MMGATHITRRVFAGLLLGLSVATLVSADQPGTAPNHGGADPAPATADPRAGGLGSIQIERERGRFAVAGRIIERKPTGGPQLLEYLAVKKGGLKSYEALMELDATAAEFNLACILIGLDPSRAVLPKFHFDPTPVQGDPVDVQVEWEANGEPRRVSASELLTIDGKPVADNAWVYTGSVFVAPGRYLAEETGTLIGFIHDQDSIVEHRVGIGLGPGTPASVNGALLPPIGTPIRVIVRNAGARE